jgi:acyl carrier protein
MEKHNSPEKSNLIPDKWNNKIQDFEDLSKEFSNTRINSYQICKYWFTARKGQALDNEDTLRYQRIVRILKEMTTLMEDIEITIQYNQLKKLEIFEKIRSIIVDKWEIEADKVTPLANFVHDLGVDSLDMMELLIVLENSFGIEFPEQMSTTLLTVQQTIDYINQKVVTE